MTTQVRIRHAGGCSIIEVPPQGRMGDVAKLIEAAVPSLPHSRQVWWTEYPTRPVPFCNDRDSFIQTDTIYVSVGDRGTIDFKQESDIMDPEGIIVKRVMDADNSCLFKAMGYVLCNKSRTQAPQLRQAVAKAVREDPETFTAAFLGQAPQDYIDFITSENAWGGQIELHVFSRLFQTEIAALDVIRDRVDIYGSKEGYQQRVFVIYDGIHYDALAFAFDEWLPESEDVTTFSPRDDAVLQKSMRLCSNQNREKAFSDNIDTSNFTLRCQVCQEGFVGPVLAQEHTKKTGHQNFREFR